MNHQYEQALDVITNTLSRVAELEVSLAVADSRAANAEKKLATVDKRRHELAGQLHDAEAKLATARVEGAREALTRLTTTLAVSHGAIQFGGCGVEEFRDREYPAPSSGEPTYATPQAAPERVAVVPVVVQAKGRTAHEIEDAFVEITPDLARRIVALAQEGK